MTFNLGYTLAHGLANYADHLTQAGKFPQNSYDYAAEMSNSILDIRSRFVGQLPVGLPIGQGQPFMNGDNFAGRWLGGWQFNGIVTEQTGSPFKVSASGGNPVDGNNPLYADCIGDAFAGRDDQSQIVHNHGLLYQSGGVFAAWLRTVRDLCSLPVSRPRDPDVGPQPIQTV